METHTEVTPSPFWKKALKNVAIAVAIGALTGAICGFLLPEVGAILPGGAGFFAPFKPEFLAVFLGVTGGVSSMLASGIEYQAGNAGETKGKNTHISTLSGEEAIDHSVPSIDGTGTLVTSVHTPTIQQENAPVHSIDHVIYESRLQVEPQTAKLKLH